MTDTRTCPSRPGSLPPELGHGGLPVLSPTLLKRTPHGFVPNPRSHRCLGCGWEPNNFVHTDTPGRPESCRERLTRWR